MTIVNSGTKTIGSFLKDDRYFVPKYQWDYSWTENQLKDLWVDLMDLCEVEMVTSHFFGQMVIHSNSIARKSISSMVKVQPSFYSTLFEQCIRRFMKRKSGCKI